MPFVCSTDGVNYSCPFLPWVVLKAEATYDAEFENTEIKKPLWNWNLKEWKIVHSNPDIDQKCFLRPKSTPLYAQKHQDAPPKAHFNCSNMMQRALHHYRWCNERCIISHYGYVFQLSNCRLLIAFITRRVDAPIALLRLVGHILLGYFLVRKTPIE